MIRLFSRSHLKISANFIRSESWSQVSTASKHSDCKLIENIKNGINHLRIYDKIELLPADLDWNYLLNKNNLDLIMQNSVDRKSNGNIKKVVEFHTL